MNKTKLIVLFNFLQAGNSWWKCCGNSCNIRLICWRGDTYNCYYTHNTVPSTIVAGDLSVNQSPLLDVDAALAAMGGDSLVYRETVSMYLEVVPKLLCSVDDALLHGDVSVIRNYAHTIKSSSRTIGGLLLGDTAENLEDLGDTVHDNVLGEMVERLHCVYREMESLLIATGFGKKSPVK